MIKNEIKRVWTKKFISLTILLLLVNTLMLSSNSLINDVKPNQLKRAFQIIRHKGYTIEFLEKHHNDLIMSQVKAVLFSDDFIEELSISGFFSEYAKLISEYDKYIDSIVSQNSEISIFNKSGEFSKQSSKLAADRYSLLKDLDLKPTNFLSLEEATSFDMTDICILIIIFYLVSVLLLEDRENGSLDFYRTMKLGRTKYAIVKIITLSIITIVIVISFYALNLTISTYKYGFIDIIAPIQSISSMITSFLKLDIFQYMILFILIKCVVFCFIAYLMALLSFLVRSYRDFFLINLAYIGVSWILYNAIDTISPYKLFRTINIIPIMRVHPLFSQLHTINIFENAVLYHHLIFAIVSIAIILSIFSIIFIIKESEIIGFSRVRLYDYLSVSRFINVKTTKGFELWSVNTFLDKLRPNIFNSKLSCYCKIYSKIIKEHLRSNS